MSKGPVVEPGIGVLPAGAIAAIVGGTVWAAANCGYNGLFDPRTFVSTAVLSAILGGGIGGLFAPTVARWVIDKEPLDWGTAVLTGVLTPTLLAVIFLVVVVPIRAWNGESFPIEGWIAGLVMLALAGAMAGLTFRALYGARTVGRR